MSNVLEGLEPAKVFSFFEEICSIPHGSYHVDAISDYLVEFAMKRGLFVIQDEEKNVLIKKPASIGMEQAPAVILQGHMDMVCEKEPDFDFDFLKDGLRLMVQGDDITAEGTTLGGDDGIAVAYALAILDDDTIVHPALEVVLTTQEEVGMEGAFGFDVSHLQGKYLINIDSEEEGTVLSSCAGGVNLTARYPLSYGKPKGICFDLTIHGLKGGHSGADIHLGRGNAITLLFRLLDYFFTKDISFQLAYLEGGGKSNAIPRKSMAGIYIDKADQAIMETAVEEFLSKVRQEFAGREDEIYVDVSSCEQQYERVYDDLPAKLLVRTMSHIADGVYRMSKDIKGLVETSSNLGILSAKEEAVDLVFSLRSSVEKELNELLHELRQYMLDAAASFIEVYGKDRIKTFSPVIEESNRYPGWQYKKDSKLRKLVCQIYEEQNHEPMKIEAIHAGLECGIFASRMDVDIVSIGPDILDIHTPKETLKIASTRRMYELLLEVLKRMGELD